KPKNQESVIPADSWPAGPNVPSVGPIVYSIYPNPADVLEGTNPQVFFNIQSLIASAPPHSYLAAWHEGLSLAHPDYITAASLFELHAALNEMCLGSNVTYGAILSTNDPWDSAPNNLGFYGLDVYANLGIDTATTQLDDLIQAAR